LASNQTITDKDVNNIVKIIKKKIHCSSLVIVQSQINLNTILTSHQKSS